MTDSTIPGEPIRCQQYIGNRHVSAIWADEIVFNTPQAAEKAFTCCAGCILQYIVICLEVILLFRNVKNTDNQCKTGN